jgi:hypothetical protein
MGFQKKLRARQSVGHFVGEKGGIDLVEVTISFQDI